jgi:glycosyltransferase involved in cell wall biosynthesis
MRVAVVMPAYQAAAFVGEAVRSVIAQTVTDWELVVVDDGSTDGTAEVADAAATGDERVRVIRAEREGLPAAVRNRAIDLTSAPLVAFLDADDVWYPNKLERQLTAFAARPEVGLVHSAADRIVQGRTLPPAEREFAGLPIGPRLVQQNFIVTSSVLVRRSLLDEHGAFDADPRMRGTEDYELWLRLLAHSEFASVDEPLLAYRVHAKQLSAERIRIDTGALVALEKTRGLHPGLESHFQRSMGILRCVQGLPGRGRRELLAAVRRDPRDRLAWTWLARSMLGPQAVRRIGRSIRRQRSARTAS